MQEVGLRGWTRIHLARATERWRDFSTR
jgi:hypothetical protein